MKRTEKRAYSAALAAIGLLASVASAQDSSPNEPKTWYTSAARKLVIFDEPLKAPGEAIPLSDAVLASMIYDTFQDENTSHTLEEMAKLEFKTPASLKADSPQRGIYNFVQLGHLQVAFMPTFARMSADAADDLYKKAKSPISEAAWNDDALAHLWVRLGDVDKALDVLDPTSSLYVEERCNLIRQAFAAAKAEEARKLADSTLEYIRKASPDVTDTHAKNLSLLIIALCDSGEIDRARVVMKELPPSEEALPAYRALCEYDSTHGEEELFVGDLNAMIDMLSKIDEFDSAQSSACVQAAEICVKLRRAAEAVRCFDRIDELSNRADPPLTLPLTWAEAARVSLYTTANDRANGYLTRCAKTLAADKDATEADQLEADIAMARVYGVAGNVAEFEKRMTSINPRLKTTKSYIATYAIRAMFVELAQVTRDEQMLNTIKELVERHQEGDGQIALGYIRRLIRTGELATARALADEIPERQWRTRALIETIHARLDIPDEAEQRAALDDANAIEDPRVAAYVLFSVGAKLSGNEGYLLGPHLRISLD